jgi:hypothetical protein
MAMERVKSKLDLMYEFRERYGTPSPATVETPVVTDVVPEKAFVTQGRGRTVITAPLREVAAVNEGFTYLHGRFVEADAPNGNGALWTTEDLQMGEATVAGGPLNWLHDDTHIVGCLMNGNLVTAREAADAGAPDIGTHITSTSALWKFLFPREADIAEKAAADHQLYYSMECLSRAVACVDAPGRPGCGEEFSYADFDAKRACAHLNGRSSISRFVDPFFLGGAVIVPPVRPGWANADVEVVRQASATAERADLADLTDEQARGLAVAILEWANR